MSFNNEISISSFDSTKRLVEFGCVSLHLFNSSLAFDDVLSPTMIKAKFSDSSILLMQSYLLDKNGQGFSKITLFGWKVFMRWINLSKG